MSVQRDVSVKHKPKINKKWKALQRSIKRSLIKHPDVGEKGWSDVWSVPVPSTDT